MSFRRNLVYKIFENLSIHFLKKFKIFQKIGKNSSNKISLTYYISYKGTTEENIFLLEGRSRLCQKIEDVVDLDLVMTVAGL